MTEADPAIEVAPGLDRRRGVLPTAATAIVIEATAAIGAARAVPDVLDADGVPAGSFFVV